MPLRLRSQWFFEPNHPSKKKEQKNAGKRLAETNFLWKCPELRPGAFGQFPVLTPTAQNSPKAL